MSYERAFESFDEAISHIDRKVDPELWHLSHALRSFCSAIQHDLNDLKGRHQTTQQNIAQVNAEVTAAQTSLMDVLKGLE